ncbi:MAG: glutamine--fructose-6-phosphate transaminase (isomerizing) [Minisyncoccia bacterium]
MCGIFAYTGKNEALPILLDGLSTLEYRGYDSAGLYVEDLGCVKSVGEVANLRKKLSTLSESKSTSGISHTRWATHGLPTETNAHPHSDCTENFWLVHNGIIENYKELKQTLESNGHKFKSETDTEVLAHLIEENYKSESDFEKAVFSSLKEIKGTYGIAVISKSEPEKIITARMGSPIAVGIGEGENFIASDSSPILRHTKSVLYLNDGEVAIITPNTYSIFNLDSVSINREPEILEWDAEQAQKGGYEHFMIKEIMEGPDVIANALRGRIILDEGNSKLGGLKQVEERLSKINRIVIVGCGTAYYSGLIGEYMIEEYAGMPVEVEIASEFRYRNPIVDSNTAVIAISQSGETIDTLSALREAKMKGALGLGIVNTVGSNIARETEAGVYNHAGPEMGVASTKAFISQITVLSLLTLFLGRQRQLSLADGQKLAKEILDLPNKVKEILAQSESIKKVAEKYLNYKDFLYIGRKYSYPIAFEGALKLKEVSYVHAEGCGAGEMKHGPIAMIDENFPTIAIAPKDSVYEKTLSNIQEIKTRKGKVLAIATKGDEKIKDLVDDVIYIPETIEALSPILTVVPLQLFAYHFAVNKGYNVDRPRNLAKSVTVE